MPRSHGVLKVAVWEVGSDYRSLSTDAQWAYQMLISQPQINNCGLLPYTPEKWWRFAADLDRDRLHAALQELEDRRLTITDTETAELLIRTFVKHDGIWKQPKLVTNARKLMREIESPRIRAYLLEKHPWLGNDDWTAKRIEAHETARGKVSTAHRERIGTTPGTPPPKAVENLENGHHEIPLTEGVSEGVTQGVSEPLTEGVHEPLSPPRARVCDGLGLPQGLPQPQEQSLAIQRPFVVANAHGETGATAHGSHDLETITPSLPEMP